MICTKYMTSVPNIHKVHERQKGKYFDNQVHMQDIIHEWLMTNAMAKYNYLIQKMGAEIYGGNEDYGSLFRGGWFEGSTETSKICGRQKRRVVTRKINRKRRKK